MRGINGRKLPEVFLKDQFWDWLTLSLMVWATELEVLMKFVEDGFVEEVWSIYEWIECHRKKWMILTVGGIEMKGNLTIQRGRSCIRGQINTSLTNSEISLSSEKEIGALTDPLWHVGIRLSFWSFLHAKECIAISSQDTVYVMQPKKGKSTYLGHIKQGYFL